MAKKTVEELEDEKWELTRQINALQSQKMELEEKIVRHKTKGFNLPAIPGWYEDDSHQIYRLTGDGNWDDGWGNDYFNDPLMDEFIDEYTVLYRLVREK